MRKGMLAVYATIAVAAALPAAAGVVDFTLTHEGDGIQRRFRPGDQVPLGGYDAELGHVTTFSDQAWIIADPTCDFTSSLALMVDGTSQVVEVHGVHEHEEPPGPQDIEQFSTVIGAGRTDAWGATFGALSTDTLTRLPLVQFGPDGTMVVMGQRTPVAYGDVFVGRGQCPGVDNRIEVTWKMYVAAREVRVWLRTFGRNAARYKFGPFPLPQAFIDEGFGRCYMYVPPETGRYLWDGVVCLASSVEIEPTSQGNTGGR